MYCLLWQNFEKLCAQLSNCYVRYILILLVYLFGLCVLCCMLQYIYYIMTTKHMLNLQVKGQYDTSFMGK